MEPRQKPEFIQILAGVLASYGKPLPESAIIGAWWANLQAYPMPTVQAAFRAYCDENGEFAPVAAGIAMRCKLMDGRPGAEEAWAIALSSRDEADTVVWTLECAEAFALCKPVLDMGDEVGARMAFKEAYTRITASARAAGRPAVWSASLGWDMVKRTAVLSKASTAGLLPAPAVSMLLPAPASDPVPDDKARAQIAGIRQMLIDSSARKVAAYEAEQLRLVQTEQRWKRETNERVSAYLAKGAG